MYVDKLKQMETNDVNKKKNREEKIWMNKTNENDKVNIKRN